jgi:glyoxylase-like metal-dependent hydrolase (beta-lactamase superfamily II)
MKENQTPGFFNFKVGDLQLTAVTDGHLLVKRVRPVQTTESTSLEIENVLRSNAVDQVLFESFLPVEEVDAALNVLVLKKDDKIILIDTGFGYLGYEDTVLPANLMMNQARRFAGKLTDNLLAAGIAKDEVTDIILTHCHIDHLGGILDAKGEEVFKKALVHISKIEYDFWTSDKPDFSNSRSQDNELSATLAKNTLKKIEHKLRFISDSDKLFGCIEVIIAPGHTPGQVALNISSNNEELLHIVDIAYNAELVFPHPEWGANLDVDFYLAVGVRKKYFEELAQSRKRAFGSHLPWPGLGFVKKTNDSYEWVSQRFSTPQLWNN